MMELSAFVCYAVKLVASQKIWTFAVSALTTLAEIMLPGPQFQKAAVVAAALLIVDFISGIMAARATGKEISSRRMARTMLKFFCYACYLLVMGAFEFIPGLESWAPGGISMVLGWIIATESYSVLENLAAIDAPGAKMVMAFVNKRKAELAAKAAASE